MAANVYGEINGETAMRQVFAGIRHDVESADSRALLTQLYRRAGCHITLTYAASWQKKFGSGGAEALGAIGEEEFSKTAETVNQRATRLRTDAGYDETWVTKADPSQPSKRTPLRRDLPGEVRTGMAETTWRGRWWSSPSPTPRSASCLPIRGPARRQDAR